MSTYDKLSATVKKIERKHHTINVFIAAVTIVALIFWANSLFSEKHIAPFHIVSFFVFFIGTALLSLLIDRTREKLSSKYRHEKQQVKLLRQKMSTIRAKVESIFQRYPSRRRGEQFKKAYKLTGKQLAELEQTLGVAMFKEGKEVFVTAFMRRGIAVRVTASIGSPYSCSNADNPKRWSEHFDRLGCDEIRQYHNHPTTSNTTSPSSVDYSSSGKLKRILGNHASVFRSFIIYWNEIKEWRILEYDEAPPSNIMYQFDAAA